MVLATADPLTLRVAPVISTATSDGDYDASSSEEGNDNDGDGDGGEEESPLTVTATYRARLAGGWWQWRARMLINRRVLIMVARVGAASRLAGYPECCRAQGRWAGTAVLLHGPYAQCGLFLCPFLASRCICM